MDTATKKRAILIEFNELCPHLLYKWMAEGKLPNFAAFFHSSDVFVTEADETDPLNLEPWIQWYSVHTGLSYKQHRVFHLTDGPKSGHLDIWKILADHGKAVWNCSSMNAKGLAKPGAIFLPDPWCTSERPYPKEISAFHRIVSWNVQEYTNKDKKLGLRDYFNFASFMASHGLSAKTVRKIATQLLSELMTGNDTYWQRAVILDRLQFDLFRHYFRKARPDFSTFFSNSTAHYQHAYWRHMDPDAFIAKPSAGELARFKDAILFGYQQMDGLMEEFLKLESGDVMLIFATALSQQPHLKNEDIGGSRFYRPKDIQKLLNLLSIESMTIAPVMTHQFLLGFADGSSRDKAFNILNGVTWNGQKVFGFSPSENNSIYFGNQIKVPVPADSQITIGGCGQSVGFYELFYKIDEIKSGRHHPDGALWFKSGRHRVHDKASILDIHPTLLDFFNIPPESVGAAPYAGESLLPALV